MIFPSREGFMVFQEMFNSLQHRIVCAAAGVSGDEAGVDLSARERRRQRNERRAELAVSRRFVKEEIVEGLVRNLDSMRKKGDHRVSKMAQLGMKWYLLRVFSNNEAQSTEALQVSLEENFPASQFEVWTPMVRKEIVSRGKSRVYMRAMQTGHVYVRCVLEPRVHKFILDERSVFNFMGSIPYKQREGYNTKMMRGGYVDVHVPSPVPDYQIEALREEVQRRDEEFEKLQRSKTAEAFQEVLSESQPAKVDVSEPRKLAVGDEADIVSGPYQNFRGTILELLPAGKAKVLVSVFGTDAELEIGLHELM